MIFVCADLMSPSATSIVFPTAIVYCSSVTNNSWKLVMSDGGQSLLVSSGLAHYMFAL